MHIYSIVAKVDYVYNFHMEQSHLHSRAEDLFIIYLRTLHEFMYNV